MLFTATPARAEEALVPQRPEGAHRMRGTHQRGQAPTRPRPMPLQGFVGMQRWVGLGVIADNLVNIGCTMKRLTAT